MGKKKIINYTVSWNDSRVETVVPIVDYSNQPRIRIYDQANDGTYWFRKIGFNRKINDDD